MRQHSDLLYQRQGFRLAHPDKPVLGRAYVQDTDMARREDNLLVIQDTVSSQPIKFGGSLHERRRRHTICHLTGQPVYTVQGMADR